MFPTDKHLSYSPKNHTVALKSLRHLPIIHLHKAHYCSIPHKFHSEQCETLIPNLLNMAAKFMAHESKLMEEITKLRTAAMANSFKDNPQEKIKNEKLLESKLKEFNLSVENYPDLKSNQTMMTAMQSMNEVEEHIAAARRFYNAAVNDLTNACEIFPSSLIASMLGIRADMPYFEAEEAAKAPVNSGDYFK